jgi:hypothetical protein
MGLIKKKDNHLSENFFNTVQCRDCGSVYESRPEDVKLRLFSDDDFYVACPNCGSTYGIYAHYIPKNLRLQLIKENNGFKAIGRLVKNWLSKIIKYLGVK